MLRPSIVRKVIRLRTSRALIRSYRTPATPIRLETPYDLGDPVLTQTFPPLYEPGPDIDSVELADHDKFHRLKLKLTQAAEVDHPELDDQALQGFYKALVESAIEDIENVSRPMIAAPRPSVTPSEREAILERLEARLDQMRIGDAGQNPGQLEISNSRNRAERLKTVLSQITLPSSSSSSRLGFSLKGKEKEDARPADLPTGLITRSEWNALFESFMLRKDARGAEAIIGIMMQHGIRPNEEYLDRILQMDAAEGRIDDVSRLTTAFTKLHGEITPSQHQAFVASLLRTSPTNVRSALQYLRQHELQGEPLPQSSYGTVLKHLTTPSEHHQPTSHTHAMAWELFTHMRLQSHPIPEKEIYCSMILACATPRDPQPERARDLWIEMTTEGNKVEPTRLEYDAIIRALSSTKRDYLEAFDLLRQMLAKHQDAVMSPFEDRPRTLWSPFVPTLSTFNALLEGTKRAGDLDRARWILSEVIGLVGSSIEIGQPMPAPDAELLTGVFMTYASWRPKLDRNALKTKQAETERPTETAPITQLSAPNLERITEAGSQMTTAGGDQSTQRSRSPQSSGEAIREATAIVQRLLADVQARRSGGGKDFFIHPFAGVQLSTRLVNSYISVHLEHAADVPAMYAAWKDTWRQVQEVDPRVRPNGWSYLFLLERCSTGRRAGETSENKSMALAWGKRIWREYLDWTKTAMLPMTPSDGQAIAESTRQSPVLSPRDEHLLGLGPRQVEKCWKYVIKLYASTGHTDVSVALLQEFCRRFPPENVRQGYQPFDAFGMTTRITDTTKLSEPNIAPHLLFEDVDVLHQKLVTKEDWVSVGVVKAITTQYAHALLKRRKFRLKNVGVAKELERFRKEQKRIERGANVSNKLPDPLEDEEMANEWEEVASDRRKSWASRKAITA